MDWWQVASFTAEPEQLVEVARTAEEVGFTGILVSDHLFIPDDFSSAYPYSPGGEPGFDTSVPFPDPWSTIAAMAAVTTTLRFATMVYILPLRHPIEVAKATATVAVLSDNRLVLGAGVGWLREEFDVMGIDFSTRGRRMDEMLEVITKLWGGGRVEHHGELFDFDPIVMEPVPSEPVPIWIGGLSPVALRRAASAGDGWIGTGHTLEEAAGLIDELHRLRRDAGRPVEGFETVVPLAALPEIDVLRRLEAAGATATMAWPFTYSVGPTSSLADKRGAMERFAEEVIVPYG